MSLLQIIVLTVVQGITEFLPVSSSGHLVLIPVLSGWEDQGLRLDVAVHVGTLGAVMVYFWRDIVRMVAGLAGGRKPERRAGRALFGHLLLSMLPVLVAGALVALLAPNFFRNPEIIAWAMIGFGVVLYAADKMGMTVRRIEHMTYRHALALGFAQVLALIPGTSRSGITMTAARAMGYERGDAARFSMLMSIPVIGAAGALAGLDIAESGEPLIWADVGLAAGLSFATAMIAIAVLLHLLKRVSFTPFVIYRLLLGAALLVWLYGYA